jgi:hypothetical protein
MHKSACADCTVRKPGCEVRTMLKGIAVHEYYDGAMHVCIEGKEILIGMCTMKVSKTRFSALRAACQWLRGYFSRQLILPVQSREGEV